MGTRKTVWLDTLRSRYNEIRVLRTGRRVDMDVAGATYATWHPEHYLTGYSWDALTAGCLLRHGAPPGSLVILGLAGGTATRQLRRLLPEATLTAVEIDPAVIRLGRRYMELDGQNLEIIIGDAYAFMGATPRQFDVVADDIYLTGHDDVRRPVAWTRNLVDRLAARLNPGGILVANFIVDVGHERVFEQARACFQDRFPSVISIAPPRGFNRILVGGDRLATPASLQAYAAAFSNRDSAWWSRLKAEPANAPGMP